MVAVGQMECEEIPVPTIGPATIEPAASGGANARGEVLVRSEMASICGSDLHMVMMGAGLVHPLPCPHGFPGHEGIGEVVESNVEHLRPGTHVLAFPNVPEAECFNEYQRLGASYCVPLPTGDVPREQLLMAQQLGTVIFAMRQHPHDVAGETVVVLGQGSAGLFFTYLLKRAGAKNVIVADLSAVRLQQSAAYGADVCIQADRGSTAGSRTAGSRPAGSRTAGSSSAGSTLQEAVADLTGGKGADYVVEAVGSSQTFLQSVDLVKIDGELLWFGLPATEDNIAMQFQKFFRKRLSAASVYGAQDEPGATSFKQALSLINHGHIDVAPLLSHVFDIEQIGDAMRLAHEPHEAGALKVSVKFV